MFTETTCGDWVLLLHTPQDVGATVTCGCLNGFDLKGGHPRGPGSLALVTDARDPSGRPDWDVNGQVTNPLPRGAFGAMRTHTQRSLQGADLRKH